MKVDILAIGVHPDDVELSCSGTLLKHIAFGKKVGLLDLTRGELGTRGSAEIRDQEAANSGQKMGASFRKNLKLADGFFENNRESQLKLIQFIRWCQPDIILANAVRDRHPDHGKAATFINDAAFLSGLMKIETTYDGENQQKWRPRAIYNYIQDYHLNPEIVVDITPYMDKKVELIMTFKSQFYDPNSNEPESPISSKAFLDSVIAKNSVFGRSIQVEYGEGFNISRPIGVSDLTDLT